VSATRRVMLWTYFGEEGVETVDLLSFFDKSVVLSYTFQGELVHEIGHEGLNHMSILNDERGTVKEISDLPRIA
jgi:hypothetical protein